MPFLPIGGPASLEIPDEQDEPPTGINLSRYVDIANGTYRLRDTSTLYATMPNVRQRVVIILRTMTYPKKMTKSFETEIAQEVRKRMRQMVEIEKRATLDGVTVERNADGVRGRALLVVSFTDLSTRERDSVQQEIA